MNCHVFSRRTLLAWATSLSLIIMPLSLMTTLSAAEPGSSPASGSTAPRRVITRVFFQDDETHALKWADLLAGDTPTLSTAQPVPGFPKIDAERQTLVQMRLAHGYLMVGVRDEEDGEFQSGWVLIDTGVTEEEHGDHSHWYYRAAPSVRAVQLDEHQGNPAHLYCYNDVFYLANDKRAGCTRLDPSTITPETSAADIIALARFVPGGGGHITLAASGQQVFATWIDRDGPRKGQIDVTSFAKSGELQVERSFHLPSGGLHGATACQGKVFFAPTDGVDWVSDAPLAAGQMQTIHHIPLGKQDDKPLRTGSFTTHQRLVGLTTGSGPQSKVCLLDAGLAQPQLVELPLALGEGYRAVGPHFIKPRTGPLLGLVFHDHSDDGAAPHRLSLLEIRFNEDGSLKSMQEAKVLDVGGSRVDGHSGHHDIDFDGDRKRGLLTNPGDGTIALLSLETRAQYGLFKVGGIPSKILCIGGSGKLR